VDMNQRYIDMNQFAYVKSPIYWRLCVGIRFAVLCNKDNGVATAICHVGTCSATMTGGHKNGVSNGSGRSYLTLRGAFAWS
jgi:hypothetical protein